MKKILLFIFLIVASMSLQAQKSLSIQSSSANGWSEKEAIKIQDAKVAEQGHLALPATGDKSSAVFENSVELGSAGNLYTILREMSNMVDASQDLNTVVFLHRCNPFIFPDETTAQYRYDISTDGGQTFELNLGPLSTFADNGSGDNRRARYPQVALYDNGSLDNSYLTYMGATHNGVDAFPWDGTTWGVARLDNEPSTFTTHVGVWNEGNVVIPNSYVEGLPGEFWANDVANAAQSSVDGDIILYKGTFNAETNDLEWEIYQIIEHFYDVSDSDGEPFTPNTVPSIGFSPDGMIGYMVTMSDGILEGYGPGVRAPYYWKTVDGGVTWDGPNIVDMRNFDGFMQDDYSGLDDGAGNIIESSPTCGFYSGDITVDANGDMHMIGLVTVQAIDDVTNMPADYSIYTAAGFLEVANITHSHSDGSWKIVRFEDGINSSLQVVSDTVVGSASFTNGPRLQISRSADATKVFLHWLDSDPALSAGLENSSRDLKGVGYDVTTGLSTAVKNFTASEVDWAGNAIYAAISPNSIVDGTTHKVPTVFTELFDPTIVDVDLTETFFHYYQGATFDNAEFTVPTVVSNYNAAPPTLTAINQTPMGQLGRSFTLEGLDPDFIHTVTWDFGDGATGEGIETDHTYPNADATYTVTACGVNYDGETCVTAEVVIETVVDTEPPVITVEEEITIEGGLDEEFELPEFSATDNVDGDITGNVVVEGEYDPTMVGTYTITYTVVDGVGNPTTVTQTINVVDTTDPEIEATSTERDLCLGDDLPDVTTLFEIEDNFIDPDSDFSEWIQYDQATDISTVGEVEVEYTPVDPSGNMGESVTITYTVCACDAEGECVEEGDTTSIEDVKLANAITLLPNPTTGIVNLNVSDMTGKFTVEVFDIQGKQIVASQEFGTSTVTIDLTNATPGMYFVQVTSENATAVKRVVVE